MGEPEPFFQIPEEINESNAEEVLGRTIDSVSHTISTLEGVLATWNAAKTKPEELRMKFDRFQKLRDVLYGWERDALLAAAKKEPYSAKISRLSQLVNICYAYA